jgi:hypothetical protein
VDKLLDYLVEKVVSSWKRKRWRQLRPGKGGLTLEKAFALCVRLTWVEFTRQFISQSVLSSDRPTESRHFQSIMLVCSQNSGVLSPHIPLKNATENQTPDEGNM